MLLLVVATAWWLFRRSPRAAYWLGWVFVGLTPVLALGRFGDVLLADRFLYLPSVGLALLAARGAAWVARGGAPARWRRPLAVAALVVLAALGAATWSRCRVWKDDLTLFSDMVRTSPASALVRNNLGLSLYSRGEYAAATEEFRLATELAGDYSLAHNNLAAALEREGDLYGALAEYREALSIAPGLMEASANAGNLLVRLGRPDEGLALLHDVVREYPRSAPALYALAGALDVLGRGEEAMPYLERARQADPSHAPTWYLWGKVLHEQGRRAEAAQSMRRFLELWDEGEGEHTAAARRIVSEVEGPDVKRPSSR
jgi:tetratricopeptide (TPR) repeat protein